MLVVTLRDLAASIFRAAERQVAPKLENQNFKLKAISAMWAVIWQLLVK
jgi:hypothetical protein